VADDSSAEQLVVPSAALTDENNIWRAYSVQSGHVLNSERSFVANNELRQYRLHLNLVAYNRHMRDIRAALLPRHSLGHSLTSTHEHVTSTTTLKQAQPSLI